MKTTCLIVDDEPLARELISEYVQKLVNFEIGGECDNTLNAMSIIYSQQVDIIFLDFLMPQMSGIDFLKSLRHAPTVIMTSDSSEYAIDCWELDVLDYLLKPITFERFFSAINKYFQMSKPQQKIIKSDGVANDAYIYVRENKRIVKIFLREIEFIEAMDEKIRINSDSQSIVVQSSLQSILERLPAEMFIRIHNSHIVSIPRIRAITSTTIDLDNIKLRIGGSYKSQVFSVLGCLE